MKITLESVVTSNVKYMEDNTRQKRAIRISKQVEGCVQDFSEKKKIKIKIEDGQSKETNTRLITLILAEEEVDKWEEYRTYNLLEIR